LQQKRATLLKKTIKYNSKNWTNSWSISNPSAKKTSTSKSGSQPKALGLYQDLWHFSMESDALTLSDIISCLLGDDMDL
jgi:hypothetical protein